MHQGSSRLGRRRVAIWSCKQRVSSTWLMESQYNGMSQNHKAQLPFAVYSLNRTYKVFASFIPRRVFENQMDSFYIGAYWGPRVQSIEEVTAAALNLFRRLAEADTLFSDWYQLGRSSKEAKEHVFVPGEDSVRQLLLRGQNRRDADRRPIGELGFSLSVWNGRVGPGAANLSILMGAASERVS